jgi:hypothetical protein
MLFFVGAFLVLISIFMFIRFLLMSQRPKLETPVKELFWGKLKSDAFGMAPQQKHARVTYTVQNKEYQGEIPLPKKTNIQVGDAIRIAYKPSDPATANYYAPRKELVMIGLIFIIGSAITAISMVLTGLLESIR